MWVVLDINVEVKVPGAEPFLRQNSLHLWQISSILYYKLKHFDLGLSKFFFLWENKVLQVQNRVWTSLTCCLTLGKLPHICVLWWQHLKMEMTTHVCCIAGLYHFSFRWEYPCFLCKLSWFVIPLFMMVLEVSFLRGWCIFAIASLAET